MSAEPTAVAVLGAGNGGCALAADLVLRGFEVRLFNRSPGRLDPIRAAGGITASGVVEGFARPSVITGDMAEAVRGARLVALTIPTAALPVYVELLADLLTQEQTVWLNPGHMGGALYLAAELSRRGRHPVPRICESVTLSHSSRMTGPASVRIFTIVSNLLVAALPAAAIGDCVRELDALIPGHVRPATSVFETGLLDLNAVEHPAQALCNAGWLEHTKGDYYFYYEGTTPAVGRVIDAVDRERLALAQALGVPTMSFVEYFHQIGFTTAEAARTGSSYQAMQHSEPNRWIKGPPGLDHRYVHEDVGWGLVPWIDLAELFDIEVPTMRALTHLASVMNGIDYRADGLTLERMGLKGYSAASVLQYVQNT
jgi:opine dehydrogenase